MSQENQELCEALKKLHGEHGPLRIEMKKLDDLAKRVGDNDYVKELKSLRERVAKFDVDLESHSAVEEDYLFELLGQHIGRNVGPIAVMEEEHNEARLHIKAFLDKVGAMIDERVNMNAAVEMAGHIEEMVRILLDHFAKEESVLFPMAERTLTDDEKESLLQAVLNR